MIRNKLIITSVALIAFSFGIINAAQKPVAPVVPWTSHSTYGIDDKTMDFVTEAFDKAGNLVSSTFNRIDSLPQVLDKAIDNNLYKILIGCAGLTLTGSLTFLGTAIVYKAYTSSFKAPKSGMKVDDEIEQRRKYGIFIGSTIALIGIIGMGGLCYYLKSSNRPISLTLQPSIALQSKLTN